MAGRMACGEDMWGDTTWIKLPVKPSVLLYEGVSSPGLIWFDNSHLRGLGFCGE